MSDVVKTPVARVSFDRVLNWYCPGCETRHGVRVKGMIAPGSGSPGAEDGWDWNGSVESPTLRPSVLVFPRGKFIDSDLPYRTGELLAPENKTVTPRCHTFIRDGKIEFLGDCEHALAGQTVPMIEWKERS